MQISCRHQKSTFTSLGYSTHEKTLVDLDTFTIAAFKLGEPCELGDGIHEHGL